MTWPLPSFTNSHSPVPERVRPLALPNTHAAVIHPVSKPVRSHSTSSSSWTLTQPVAQRPVAEQLFLALAEAKIWTSKIAMHLDVETRDRLFRQLDILHEVDEWAEGDQPLSLASYKSMVRAMLFHKVNCRPSLSLMPNGNLLALWERDGDRLNVEFLPEDRTRWFVQHATPKGPERAAGTSALERLRDVLDPYEAGRWFDGS